MESTQADVRERLREVNTATDALARQTEDVERLGDSLNEQSYVRGRIDHYLQTLEAADDAALTRAEQLAEERRAAVRSLEEQISYETVRENVTSILNVVGEDMRASASG